jgi:hypothetical protein
VTVTAASPIVDPKSATVGQDITLQLTESLPTGRSYQSYLQLVPGVMPDDPTTSGNPAARGGINYSDIAGNIGVSSDNVYYFDGINVTDPVTGTFGANLNTEIIQEQKVITGGIPAEYVGTPGSSRTSSPSRAATPSPVRPTTSSRTANLVAENQNGADDEFSTKDNGYTFGGPIYRDKAWFFGSYRYNNREDDVSTLDTQAVPALGRQHAAPGLRQGHWAPTQNDLLSFTYLSDPTEITGRRERDITNARDRGQDQGGHRYGGNYTRVWGNAPRDRRQQAQRRGLADFVGHPPGRQQRDRSSRADRHAHAGRRAARRLRPGSDQRARHDRRSRPRCSTPAPTPSRAASTGRRTSTSATRCTSMTRDLRSLASRTPAPA